jgi:hypothetical protein
MGHPVAWDWTSELRTIAIHICKCWLNSSISHKILSRVYGSVADNSGFWTGWLFVAIFRGMTIKVYVSSIFIRCTSSYMVHCSKVNNFYKNISQTLFYSKSKEDPVDYTFTARTFKKYFCIQILYRPSGVKNFLFSTLFRRALGPTQSPIQWVPAAISPGVKRPGREVDHLPSTSAEVRNMWAYTSTPPYAFMA